MRLFPFKANPLTDITVIIPVGRGHEALAVRAVRSVELQTVPCEIIVIHDDERRGAGWARNQGLAQVSTPFTVFLDADDYLLPTYAERTLKAHTATPTRYIYVDYWQRDKRMSTPNCAWFGGSWHCITSLVPTAWAAAVDGFDETLTGAEDTDFYLKLLYNGYCGRRLPEALFVYTPDGARSKAFRSTVHHEVVMHTIHQRYKDKAMACGDGTPCGEIKTPIQPPAGDQLPGDVLVRATWLGNMSQTGKISGRRYPRTNKHGAPFWADNRDLAAMPELFQRITNEEAEDPIRMMARVMGWDNVALQRQPAPPPIPFDTLGGVGEPAPEVGRLLELYAQLLSTSNAKAG